MSEFSITHHAAYAAFGLISVDESALLYPIDRESAEAWCIYAAQIVEAGAGGPAPASGDGDDNLPPPIGGSSLYESSDGQG